MKSIIGAYLIDAPFSALNNRGIDKKAAFENEVVTKTIYSPEGTRPYVSGQALRYWWRTVLEKEFGWQCSTVEKIGKNQAVTKGDPFTYPDDDVFGYMSARKAETDEFDKSGKPKMESVTVTRISPLKCSPLIGLPINPTSDFGTLVRKLENDPILFNHQFYSNILKGICALDLDSVGRYTMINRPGSMNLSKDLAVKYEQAGLKTAEKTYMLPLDIRKKRISDTMMALKYLTGGAMSALHYTDVTPKLLILAVLNNGNNIFMNVLPHNKYSNGLVNIDALSEVLVDYKDDLLTKVYLGKISGFGSEKDKELDTFKANNLIVTTPVRAIELLLKEIEEKKLL